MPNSAANIIVIVAFINVHTLRLGQNSVIKKTTDSSACTHDDIASLYQQLETPLNFIAYESGQLLCDFVSCMRQTMLLNPERMAVLLAGPITHAKIQYMDFVDNLNFVSVIYGDTGFQCSIPQTECSFGSDYQSYDLNELKGTDRLNVNRVILATLKTNFNDVLSWLQSKYYAKPRSKNSKELWRQIRIVKVHINMLSYQLADISKKLEKCFPSKLRIGNIRKKRYILPFLGKNTMCTENPKKKALIFYEQLHLSLREMLFDIRKRLKEPYIH